MKDSDGRLVARRSYVLINPVSSARDLAGVYQALLESRCGVSREESEERAWGTPAAALVERLSSEVVPAPFDGSGSTTS